MTIGVTEAILIGAAVMLLFGASRLPQLMSALGKGIREFKSAVREDEEESATKEAGSQAQRDAEQSEQSSSK